MVRGGALMSRGMGRFAHLSDAEVEGLRHFIRQRARELGFDDFVEGLASEHRTRGAQTVKAAFGK